MKKPTLITSYTNPDLDGTACACAYAEFLNKTGEQAICGLVGDLHIETNFVLDQFNIERPLILENSKGYEEIVLVDTSHIMSLRGNIDHHRVVEIIDHHKKHEVEKFPNVRKVQIELIGAAATLIAERFIAENVEISRESAILLMGGIISNTLNFKAGQTHQRDRDAYDWLNKTAFLPEDFWKDLFHAKSDAIEENLHDALLFELAIYDDFGNVRLGITQLEIVGGGELLAQRLHGVIESLKDLQREKDLDLIFLTIISLDEDKNYFVTQDTKTMDLLRASLDITFQDNVAIREGMIMRKEIVPLIEEVLEK